MKQKNRLFILGLLGVGMSLCHLGGSLGVAYSELSMQEPHIEIQKAQIMLEGEVQKPGLYAFEKGATLSKILVQAGGFTPHAYPIGAIFMRDFKEGPQKRARMLIEADYVVLQMKPELDIVLQPGDHLIIPKRPNHIWVEGKVRHPQAILFESGLSAKEYIHKVGGVLENNDLENVFAYLPNGKIKKLSISSWNYKDTQLPPGTRICVE
jgi:polysaccharide export outer membrane protein